MFFNTLGAASSLAFNHVIWHPYNGSKWRTYIDVVYGGAIGRLSKGCSTMGLRLQGVRGMVMCILACTGALCRTLTTSSPGWTNAGPDTSPLDSWDSNLNDLYLYVHSTLMSKRMCDSRNSEQCSVVCQLNHTEGNQFSSRPRVRNSSNSKAVSVPHACDASGAGDTSDSYHNHLFIIITLDTSVNISNMTNMATGADTDLQWHFISVVIKLTASI